MREIFFRGKTKGGKWIYGSHFFDGEKHFIVRKRSECFYEEFEVDPKTVGEYTGIVDKKGIKIYEGDIILIKTWLNFTKGRAIVKFNSGSFVAGGERLSNWTNIEIIGNRVDDVELMKGYDDN